MKLSIVITMHPITTVSQAFNIHNYICIYNSTVLHATYMYLEPAHELEYLNCQPTTYVQALRSTQRPNATSQQCPLQVYYCVTVTYSLCHSHTHTVSL